MHLLMMSIISIFWHKFSLAWLEKFISLKKSTKMLLFLDFINLLKNGPRLLNTQGIIRVVILFASHNAGVVMFINFLSELLTGVIKARNWLCCRFHWIFGKWTKILEQLGHQTNNVLIDIKEVVIVICSELDLQVITNLSSGNQPQSRL